MASNITQEQIEFFKMIMNLAEPYPLEVLHKLPFDSNAGFDEARLDATRAKQILIEHGILEK